jgi:hypothetical protein
VAGPAGSLQQGNPPLKAEQALYLHYGRNHWLWPEVSGVLAPEPFEVPGEHVEAVRLQLCHWAAAV